MPENYRKLTFKSRLDRLPPFLALALTRVRRPRQSRDELRKRFWRYAARQERRQKRELGIELPRRQQSRRITFKEIRSKSGLSYWWVNKISNQVTWDKVPTGKMLAFLDGCGIELSHMAVQRWLVRRGLQKNQLFKHLNDRQMERFNRRMKEWKEIRAASDKA